MANHTLTDTKQQQNLAATDDTRLYENMEGAQTGGTRAFNANASSANIPSGEQQTAALHGRPDTHLPHSERQGITNHSANEEAARNQKVVDERADAQATTDPLQ